MYLFFAPLFGMVVVFLIRVCIDVAPEILSHVVEIFSNLNYIQVYILLGKC